MIKTFFYRFVTRYQHNNFMVNERSGFFDLTIDGNCGAIEFSEAVEQERNKYKDFLVEEGYDMQECEVSCEAFNPVT